MDKRDSFSVSVRLQRVTTKSARVSVLITAELIQPDPDDPETGRIDIDKLFQAAIEGKLPTTDWKPEGGPVITPHPWQSSPDVDPQQARAFQAERSPGPI